MGGGIQRQVELAPHSSLLLAVFANFPFAFAIDLEAGGIDDQMSYRALAGEAVFDVDGLGALADTVNGMVAPPKPAAPVPTCGTIHSSM